MLQDQEGLFSIKTPLVFADGTAFYNKLAKEFVRHKKGFFILAPSGVGKSYYIRGQKPNQRHWIDADRVWRWSRAMPKGAWWEEPLETILGIEQQCDIITAQAKKMGFWMMGASNHWLKPDAIVLPHWQTNLKYIRMREKNYDGGAKSDPVALKQLRGHRHWIAKWAKLGVPKFKSINEAVNYLETIYKKIK